MYRARKRFTKTIIVLFIFYSLSHEIGDVIIHLYFLHPLPKQDNQIPRYCPDMYLYITSVN